MGENLRAGTGARRIPNDAARSRTIARKPPWRRPVTLGVAIPALIYALTKCGALMWIDCNTRTA